MKVLVDQVLDNVFGLQHDEVEERISSIYKHDYAGEKLSSEAFLTSYSDFATLYKYIPTGYNFYDLGAGNFRSVYFFKHFFNFKTYGVEIHPGRVESAMMNRGQYNLESEQFITGDFTKQNYNGPCFFFYYLPAGELLHKTIDMLKVNDYFAIIESHGECFSQLEYYNDIQLIHTLSTSSNRHSPELRIYKKTSPRARHPHHELLDALSEQRDQYIEISSNNPIIGNYRWVYNLADTEMDFSTEKLLLKTLDGQLIKPNKLKKTTLNSLHTEYYRRVLQDPKYKKLVYTPRPAFECSDGTYLYIEG